MILEDFPDKMADSKIMSSSFETAQEKNTIKKNMAERSLMVFECAFDSFFQWIGLRENLQESPIFNGKIYGFL